jgi:hypothetical protein
LACLKNVVALLGLMLILGRPGYIAESISRLLVLPFRTHLAQFGLVAAFVGEGSLALWLLTRGFHVPQTDEISDDNPLKQASKEVL